MFLSVSLTCAARAQQPALQVLSHQVRPVVSNHQAALVGALPSDQQLSLSIVLQLQNQDALTTLLSQLYDPASPDFHHFLTVDQFTAKFSPSADSFQSVVAFAQANGLTVTETPANRLIVPVTGSVDAINRAFNVSMNLYQHPTENRTFFSPDRDPSLPASLPVAHISGLNNYLMPHPNLVRPQATQVLPAVTGSGPGGSYLGSDMRAAYYGASTLTGNGQSVGLLEFDGYSLSDVNSTFTNAGQTYTVPINNVLLDGATGTGTTFDGEGEVVLDIVQAIGMAPGLDQVRVYIGNGQDDAHLLNSMASENLAKVISCSWSWSPDDPSTDDVFFQEFAAQGQSFLTASGDSGAFDSTISPYFYPQEDAFVTAVGGTHLTTTGPAGSWSAESAWNSSGAGSGGGISPDNIGIPSWQSGLANTANGGSTTLRNVPDVAMEGDFDNYSCAMGSCSSGYAGTSFAAPRWAGFLALINQQAVEAGTAPQGGIGFLNPALYRLAQAPSSAADLHDITSGNNDTGNQPTWFSAVAGYDLVTGWGSANGQSLINDLAGPQVPGFWLQASSPTVDVDQGTSSSTTLTVTDAGGFSGPVTLAITSTLPSGVTATWSANPTQATSVLTLTATNSAAPGVTTLTLAGTSGNLSAQTTVTVAVHAPAFSLSASSSSVSLNQGGTTSTTLTVTPEYGFTGAVTLAVTGLPAGVTASPGTNPTTGASVLTFTASTSASPGTTPLTITGTAGSLSATLSLSLSVHAPSFTLSSNSTLDIGQGASGMDYIYVSDLYGFNGSVNLAVTGLPAGVTAAFSPNPTTGSSYLTLTAASNAPVGSSLITITGTSGSLSSTTTTTLGVHVPTFTLSNPGTISVGQGSSSNAYLYINPQYGFTGSVTFSIAGLPSGVTALWNPNPSNGNTSLTLAAASSVPVGQYNLTVTGTSGSQTATTTLTLGVYAPTFTLYSTSTNIGQGSSATSFVTISPQYGFTGSVNLAASNLPSGVTASFSPNPSTSNSTITFNASSTTPTGQYTVTITGTSGTKSVSTTITLGVYQPTFTLSGGGSVNLGQGTSATSYLYVTPQYGFNGSVNLSIAGLPAGVTASFSPNPTTGYASLILTASSTAALGQHTVTITGTSGSQTATTVLTVSVYVPTFTLSSSTNVSVGQGNSATGYIYVYDQYGFTGSVTLSVSGLPAGVTATLSPNPTTSNSTLTFIASSTAALGQYTVTITGTSGAQTASTTLTLGVYAPTFTLSGNTLVNIGQGSAATGYVYLSNQYGFNSPVNLSIAGLPAGVTAAFSPNPTSYYSTITFTASATAALGQYTVTITGTSGAQTAATTLTLGVYAPSFLINGYFGAITLNQGASSTASFFLSNQYGFNSPVTLTASGLPTGVTAAFAPNPTTSNSTLTLTASSSATPGPATVTVTGTSGSVTASTTFSLTVNASTFTLADAPSQITLTAGASAKTLLTVLPQYGFAAPVALSISGLPAGVTGAFTSGTINSTGTLTLAASASATPGTTTATITGTSGALTTSVPLAITISNAPGATTTALGLTAAGSPLTTVASPSAITLTATVTAGATALTSGQILFCDLGNTTTCDANHQIGTAQLTAGGTATLTLIPAPGNHSFQASFAGLIGHALSLSPATGLTVTATQATATTLAQSGAAGQYTLAATVTGQGVVAPTGSVNFIDTSNNNASLATATLASAAAPVLSFSAAQTTATNFSPTLITVGDFNGDGRPDLAVLNPSSSSLAILLGNGDGTFTAQAAAVPTGSQPITIAAADLNADGKLDLVVVNSGSNSLSVLLGNGDGTFTPSSLSPQTGSYPHGLAIGDFNADGKLDLAIANSNSNSLTVLLGNGDGTFTPSSFSPQTGSYPIVVTTADFNSDGVADLAILSSNSNSLTLFFGNGDGTFSTAATLTVSGSPITLVGGDFNRDGNADLAIASLYNGNITLLLGNGDGTFTTSSVTVPQSYGISSLAVADLNHDGVPDLIASTYGKAFTLLGNGDGTFTAGPSITLGGGNALTTATDLNGDGVPELIAPNNSSNNIAVYTGLLTQATHASATGISPTGTGQHAVNAIYAGDSLWHASTSAALQLTAKALTPTLAVTPQASTITTAQALAVNVTVSPVAGQPTPTGSVILASGNYTSAAASLVSGAAILNIPANSLTAGAATLTATYTPDSASANLYGTTSATSPLTVTLPPKTTPTLTVTPSVISLTTQQTVTINLAVTGPNGYPTPTGAIILAGAGFTSAATPLASGAATLTIPANSLNPGSDILTATYTPDTGSATVYNSASGSTTLTVTPPPKTTPTITLTASSNTLNTAQPVTLTLHVTGTSATPTGSITLTGTGYTSAPISLASGAASLTIPANSLSPGIDILTATYTPDTTSAATYNSAMGTLTLTVSAPAKAPTMTITPSSSTITTAQSLTVPVSLAANTPLPTGSVTLTSGAFTAQRTLSAGTTTFTLAAGALPTGINTLTATYTPDTPSSAAYTTAAQTASITVSPAIGTATATLSLTPSATSITDLQTLTISVTAAGSGSSPTGTILLSIGAYTAQQTLANSAASFTLPAGTLTTGQNTLTATYSGDPIYAPSNASTLVTAASLLLAASAPPAIVAGATASSTLAFSAGTYAGTLNLACTLTSAPQNAQSQPTCRFNPAAVQVASGSTASATVTFSTTAASTATLTRPNLWKPLAPAFASLLLLFLPCSRRRRLPLSLLVLLFGVLAASLTGCGGGSDHNTTTTSATPATTSGQYTFTITGTDATSTKTTASTAITLTVQ